MKIAFPALRHLRNATPAESGIFRTLDGSVSVPVGVASPQSGREDLTDERNFRRDPEHEVCRTWLGWFRTETQWIHFRFSFRENGHEWYGQTVCSLRSDHPECLRLPYRRSPFPVHRSLVLFAVPAGCPATFGVQQMPKTSRHTQKKRSRMPQEWRSLDTMGMDRPADRPATTSPQEENRCHHRRTVKLKCW